MTILVDMEHEGTGTTDLVENVTWPTLLEGNFVYVSKIDKLLNGDFTSRNVF